MRSRRNLLSILVVVLLILAVVYFVRQRQGGAEVADEPTTAEVGDAATGDTAVSESTTPTEEVAGDTAVSEGDATTGETAGDTAVSGGDATTGEVAGDTASPSEASSEAATSAEGSIAAETAGETAAVTTAEGSTTDYEGPTISYVVQPGDNLFLIGLPYGLLWTDIADLNNLDNPNDLTVGQEILIPAATTVVSQPPAAPAAPAVPAVYKVQAGENLFRIALRYNMDWRYLAQANGIGAPYVLYVGQELVIP